MLDWGRKTERQKDETMSVYAFVDTDNHEIKSCYINNAYCLLPSFTSTSIASLNVLAS